MVLPLFSFMAKHLRFKLKFKVPSFQLCCSKRHTTVPSIYRLSPMNPKARDIVYPNLPPPPPPSTPEYQFMVPKIMSNNSACNDPQIVQCESTFCKFGRSDIIKDKKVIKSKGRTSISSSRALPSNLLNNNYKLDNDMEEESDSLLSSLNSFSDEFCHTETHKTLEIASPLAEAKLHISTFPKPKQVGVSCIEPPLHNRHEPEKEVIVGHEKKKSIAKRVGGGSQKGARMHSTILSRPDQVRVLCTGSHFFNNHKPEKELNVRQEKEKSITKKVGGGSDKRQMKKKNVMVSKPSMTPNCNDGGIVKESFAMVKKSNDPYEDFKKSMMEMMMEMEVLESKELERLLQCFLDLNSRCYHGVIVQAFMDIWQQLFSETYVHQNSQNNREDCVI